MDEDAVASAPGRQRASSGVSLRPFAGLQRMRSRSLLQQQHQHQQGTGGSSSSSKRITSSGDERESSVETVAEYEASGHDDDHDHNGVRYGDDEDDALRRSAPDTSKERRPASPSQLPTASPKRILPFLQRSFTPPLAGSASSSASGSGLSSPPLPSFLPKLGRQRSYLALSIPTTPPAATSSASNSKRLVLKEDDDEDTRLVSAEPRSSSESIDRHRIAATPLHLQHSADIAAAAAASFTSPSRSRRPSTSLSQHQQNTPKTLSQLLPPLIFLCFLFCASLVVIYFLISTIPLTLPHTVSEIRAQTSALRDYSRQGWREGVHVSAVLSALFVFKQAFSVPGSILVNILFGSLYGTYAATLCACIFTGVGSVCAYYMAQVCAPLVERYLPRALSRTKSSLLSSENTTSADLFSYLLLARLFPLLPYSLLNIACGVLHIPVYPFFATLVLGSFPYNFVTTQLGDLLANLATATGANGENVQSAGSINDIWTWDLCFKLAVASILSAAPVIFKKQLQALLGGGKANAGSSVAVATRRGSLSNNALGMTHINPQTLMAQHARPLTLGFPSGGHEVELSTVEQEKLANIRSQYTLDGSLQPAHAMTGPCRSFERDYSDSTEHSTSSGESTHQTVPRASLPSSQQYEFSIPLLKRDRTDSTASEILAGPHPPPLSASSTITSWSAFSPIADDTSASEWGASPSRSNNDGSPQHSRHAKKSSWSWSWDTLRSSVSHPKRGDSNNLSNASTDTASIHSGSDDSGYVSSASAALRNWKAPRLGFSGTRKNGPGGSTAAAIPLLDRDSAYESANFNDDSEEPSIIPSTGIVMKRFSKRNFPFFSSNSSSRKGNTTPNSVQNPSILSPRRSDSLKRNILLDQESGDTDEEDRRERRVSREFISRQSMYGDRESITNIGSSARRTASIDTTSASYAKLHGFGIGSNSARV